MLGEAKKTGHQVGVLWKSGVRKNKQVQTVFRVGMCVEEGNANQRGTKGGVRLNVGAEGGRIRPEKTQHQIETTTNGEKR